MSNIACRSGFSGFRSGVLVVGLVVSALAMGACSGTNLPVGHVKRALDPAGFAQAASGPEWEMAAVRVTAGPGVDYSSSSLTPVLLVFRNKGPSQPQVILEDVRAVGKNAEYMVYGADEAMRLATTATFSRKAGSAAKGAAVGAGVGAALGAGAGAVANVLTGGKNPQYIWMGAAGGGAAGGLTGAALSDSSFSKAEQEAIRADLVANIWQEDPITPGTTRMGYLLVPAGLEVKTLRILVRSDAAMETRTLQIASEKDYDAARAMARAQVQAPAQSACAPQAPPAGKDPRADLPARPQPPVESAGDDEDGPEAESLPEPVEI